MKAKRDDDSRHLEGQRVPFWRNSTYEEPTWVSLAWIIVPLLTAGILIYVVIG
jgi:hypothetical protein